MYKGMNDNLFPLGSFCIELTNKQSDKMFKLLEKKKIPFDYIYEGTYTGGFVASNPEKESVLVLQISDEGKNWLASIDYLKRSKDGVFVKLLTPENPDDGEPMLEFKDVFKVFEFTDEKSKKD